MLNENLDPTGQHFNSDELQIEKSLRPKALDDFSGQPKIVENLQIFIQAAKQRGEALDHVLLHGPPGLGKTTLSHIIANELETDLKMSSGPVLEKPGDLAGLLTNLDEGDVVIMAQSNGNGFVPSVYHAVVAPDLEHSPLFERRLLHQPPRRLESTQVPDPGWSVDGILHARRTVGVYLGRARTEVRLLLE